METGSRLFTDSTQTLENKSLSRFYCTKNKKKESIYLFLKYFMKGQFHNGVQYEGKQQSPQKCLQYQTPKQYNYIVVSCERKPCFITQQLFC